jgi:hypothetical protein
LAATSAVPAHRSILRRRTRQGAPPDASKVLVRPTQEASFNHEHKIPRRKRPGRSRGRRERLLVLVSPKLVWIDRGTVELHGRRRRCLNPRRTCDAARADHLASDPKHPARSSPGSRFLIDGRLAWVEHDAPYIFGGDDNGANRGYLITTWLSPGPHVFIAKVIDTAGRMASNTVNASVMTAPQPPTALRGIWTRIITVKEIAKLAGGPLAAGGSPPAGRWELAFDKVGAWYLDPQGSAIAHDLIVRDHTLTIDAPIQMAPFNNGQSTTTAYGHKNIGGTDRTPAGCPCETYQWSRSSDTLTLAVLHCRIPAARLIDGVWACAATDPANVKP